MNLVPPPADPVREVAFDAAALRLIAREHQLLRSDVLVALHHMRQGRYAAAQRVLRAAVEQR